MAKTKSPNRTLKSLASEPVVSPANQSGPIAEETKAAQVENRQLPPQLILRTCLNAVCCS